MSHHKVVFHAALIVLTLAVVFAGCRRSTPIIEVTRDTAPSFMDSVSHQTYPVGTAIRPLTLPAASGGNGRLNYTLGPELPPGLSFDSAARTLTGTPEMEGVFDLRYRVEDADDNTSAADSDTLHFTVTVVPQASVATVVSSVRSGSVDGTLTFESLPEASAGPGIAGVTGNQVVTNGGSFFLEVAAERPAAKLLVAMFLPDAAASNRPRALRDRPARQCRPVASAGRAGDIRSRSGTRVVLPGDRGGGRYRSGRAADVP